MGKLCSCTSGIANLGTPNCIPTFGIIERLALVQLTDSEGNLNKIDPSAAFDQSFLDGLVSEVDSTKRLILTPDIKNLTNERSETEYETFDDGTKCRLRSGIRTISGLYVGKGIDFYRRLASMSCVKLGVYLLSDCDGIMGEEGADGFLYPIAIENFEATWLAATSTTCEKVGFTFDFKRSVEDEDLQFIAGDYVDGDFDLSPQIIDVKGTYTNVTTTASDVVLNFYYGSYGNKLPLTGLTIADVASITNVTTGGALTVASVTDLGSGKYTIAYTGTSSIGDSIQFEFTSTGYDFSSANAVVSEITA